eukprot:gnl/TRDRNA2_/TRDRNA2_28560_c0_seq1.p1 gnl/TRDRNA2_/TRDRNA2_28560_c0~~gnl/TRDRNA2_/TRDRNA2_28560_c0_seq1.p1  ORF type:complete len:452 (+),score=75.50 gnl/TRDRNA2_/TRDRNA2_28560_c0_seq1:27-1382(+)
MPKSDDGSAGKKADGDRRERRRREMGEAKASEVQRARAMRCIERAQRFRAQGRHPLAKLQMRQGQRLLQETIDASPAILNARFLLVGCLLSMESFEEAKKHVLALYSCLSKQSIQEMRDPVLFLAVAHASRRLGEIESAIDYLQEATEVFPEHPQPCVYLSELLSYVGRTQTGAEASRLALARDAMPSCPSRLKSEERVRALRCLGECLTDQGLQTEAEACFREACEVESSTDVSADQVEQLRARKNQEAKSPETDCNAIADNISDIRKIRTLTAMQLTGSSQEADVADITPSTSAASEKAAAASSQASSPELHVRQTEEDALRHSCSETEASPPLPERPFAAVCDESFPDVDPYATSSLTLAERQRVRMGPEAQVARCAQFIAFPNTRRVMYDRELSRGLMPGLGAGYNNFAVGAAPTRHSHSIWCCAMETDECVKIASQPVDCNFRTSL